MKNRIPDVTIIGGGPIGSLMAIVFAQQGLKIDLFEKSSDLRVVSLPTDRSISLSLIQRGFNTLELANLMDAVEKVSVKTKYRHIHNNLTGDIESMLYGSENDYMWTMGRHDLNIVFLKELAKYPNVNLYFNHKLVDIMVNGETLTVKFKVGEQYNQYDSGTIFGVDGTGSQVRLLLQRYRPSIIEQESIGKGYKALTIPSDINGDVVYSKEAINLFPRNDFMIVGLPNKFTNDMACLLFMEQDKLDELQNMSVKKLEEFFYQEYPLLTPNLSPDFAKEYLDSPFGRLGTIKCDNWHFEDKIVLMGDSCHTTVPFMNQGCNSSMEDVYVMYELFKSFGTDWNSIFPLFQQTRKSKVDAMIGLSIDHYSTLCTVYDTKDSVFKKELLQRLIVEYPTRFIDTHKEVNFSDTSYDDIWRRKQEQDVIINNAIALCSYDMDNIIQVLNLDEDNLLGKVVNI